MTADKNNGAASVAIGVEVARPDVSGRMLRDGQGHRYETIVARFPTSGRYAYGYSGVSWNRMFETFQDMIDKDPHLASVLETRRKAVTARPWRVEAASESARDREIAAFVTDVLRNVRDFELALKNMLGSVAFGWNVSEVLWKRRPDGRVGVEAVKSKWPGRFLFDAEGRLCFKKSRWDAGGTPTPERKFTVAVFGGEHDNPYGVGLCLRAFWYWWFKKNALRFWNLFNEKYGSPLAVAKHPPGASEEVRNKLREVLEALQTDSGVVLEDGQAIEFVQPAGAALGRVNQFLDLAEFCNAEISKLFIGGTLAVAEGRGSGSLAQARVHDEVRNDYVEDDARMLMGVVNGQLVRWIVDVNFGEGVAAPRFAIDTDRDRDLGELTNMVSSAVRLGLPIARSWIYQQLGIPQPREGERSLRYDDQNLYQYHLQWGVLTINEVRESLGLGPVAHGDLPPNPQLLEQLASLGLIKLPKQPQYSAPRPAALPASTRDEGANLESAAREEQDDSRTERA